jgi:hypothetical protein
VKRPYIKNAMTVSSILAESGSKNYLRHQVTAIPTAQIAIQLKFLGNVMKGKYLAV